VALNQVMYIEETTEKLAHYLVRFFPYIHRNSPIPSVGVLSSNFQTLRLKTDKTFYQKHIFNIQHNLKNTSIYNQKHTFVTAYLFLISFLSLSRILAYKSKFIINCCPWSQLILMLFGREPK
jgi:hypothetical protein